MRSSLLIVPLFLGLVTASSEAEDASSMLLATLAKYTNVPPTYYVEGTRETTTTDEIQHNFEQERFAIARASSNRYHYDIRIPDRWNIVIADGITEWDFQPWRNEYTKHPVPTTAPDTNDPDDVIRYVATSGARHYITDLSRIRIEAAEFLPPEDLTLVGQRVPCYVIRARYQNTGPAAVEEPAQVTFWIEKQRKVIRKETVVSTISPSVLQPLRKVKVAETTYYTIVDLQGPPPAALLRFSPPNGAKQVRRLFFNDRNIDLTGFPAPPLKMKTLDGRPFDSNSVKGHALLVDFWASWCVPCIQQMRSLSKLADELSKQGLIFIGINWGDDDPKTALEFLKKNHYDWINLRADSETASAWMLNGVPLVAVIDPEGNIAYYHNGYEEPEERAIVNALRKINPIFSTATAQCQGSAETP